MMGLARDLILLTIPLGLLFRDSRWCQTSVWGRVFALISGVPFSTVPLTTRGSLSVRKMSVEKLWQEFFSDPSQWWDHRSEKTTPKYPDFKHKHTQQSLWLNNKRTPPWVEAELAAMSPGIVQSNIFSWNLRLRRYVKTGDYKTAMNLFQQILRQGMTPDKFTFVPVLNACSGLSALEEGRRIHLQIIKSGLEYDVCVATCLVDMYAKCGRIKDARRVFNKMPTRDAVSWSALILGYVNCGQGQEALRLFRLMQQEGVNLSRVTFIGVLNACASIGTLEEGRRTHEQIIDGGYECDLRVANSLVDMYAKCGSIEDAQRVFNKMPKRNVISWSTLILGYVKCGQGQKALELSGMMQQEGVDLDPVSFVGVLNACASVGALEIGRLVHKQIIDLGYESNTHVANSLIDMYAKCGSIKDAQRVFDNMLTRDVVSWSSLILGHVKCGHGNEALELSRLMQREGVVPNPVTLVGVLNACASIGELEEGRCVHKQVIDRGYEANTYVASSLIDMYTKCGSIEDARRVFNKMPTKDVVSSNALILGHVRCGQGQEALEIFHLMQQEGWDLSPVTFVAVLNACASIGALEEGRCAHEQIINRGYECDAYVASSLVDMYAKCGSIEDAQRVFNKMLTRDVVSWSALILGYVRCGRAQQALELSQQMQREGLELDRVTFVGVVNACASIGALGEGRRVHEKIIDKGYECDPYVVNSLVGMYAKCGSLDEARKTFSKIPTRDTVTWGPLILGHVKYGQGWEALELSQLMQREGVNLDPLSFVGVLNACASTGALEEGRCAHKQIIDRGYESDVYVANSLIDMYAKCGSIEDAEKVFHTMPSRDMVSWNAMLAGYCRHGYVKEALKHFERMCQDVEVDTMSFVSLLSVCSHTGLVDEGMGYFESMSAVFNILPASDHYALVIDLLGRAGHLHEAEDLIMRFLSKRDTSVWKSLLGACRIHGNVEIGEHVAKRVLSLDPGNTTAYVLLANIYAAAGKWNRVQALHHMRLERDAKNTSECTSIEVENKVHSFKINDSNHPQLLEIHAELERLLLQIREVGYVPITGFTLHCVGQGQKELHLYHHTEQLAIAFGLISTAPGTPLRIVKNRRLCDDCHTATKLITKLVGRRIVVRDTNRFHHFDDGLCSCRDVW